MDSIFLYLDRHCFMLAILYDNELHYLAETVIKLFHVGDNMHIEKGKYYHLFNRSNNNEIVFKQRENYSYFLDKYQDLIMPLTETLAYCLMPTHFHFCVKIVSDDVFLFKKNIGVMLSSYTRALNKRFDRHGSLFQHHTNATEINGSDQLEIVCHYIHQNPVRASLVTGMEEWSFSSYQDIAGLRMQRIPISHEVFPLLIKDGASFQAYSEQVWVKMKKRLDVTGPRT